MSFFSKLGHVVAFPVTAPIKLLNGSVTKYAESIILGQVRHLLTLGAGYLISQGFLANSDEEKFVGALIGVVAMIMSAAAKKAGIE